VIAVGFAVVVARRLTIEAFGLWGIILSVSLMLSSITTLWKFWTSRFLARGYKEAATASLGLSLIYCLVGSLIYLAISYLEWHLLGWGLNYMLIGLLVFILYVLNDGFEGIISVTKPELLGYRTFIYETLRLILAIVLVKMLNLGLLGAILSVEVSLLITVLYMFLIVLRWKLISWSFPFKLALQWLKAGYIPLLNMIYNSLIGGVRAFTSWLTGSEVIVAYLNVGFSAQTPLSKLAQASTFALYARLLRKPRPQDLTETLRIYFTASGFVVTTLIVLSRSIASIFNPKYYLDAYIIIIIVALYSLVASLSSIYLTAVLGSSDIDRQGLTSHRILLSSPLFRALLVRVLGVIIAYGISALLILSVPGENIVNAVNVCLALLIASTITLSYMYYKARKLIPHKIPYREAIAVVIASITILVYYYLTRVYTIIIHSFWSDTPTLIIHLTIALAIYSSILLALSPWTRGVLKQALKTTIKT